jgi:ketosteroid isomerase-like protein
MTRTWLGGLIVAATIAGASPLHAQRAPNPERAAVVRIIEAVAELIQAGNLSAVDTLYAPRGVHIIEGIRVSHGWAEHRDSVLKPDIEHLHELHYRYYGVEAQVRESVAWASFRYELSGHAASGPVATEGRGTAVLEKQEGKWVIVHMHTAGQPRAAATGGSR